MSSRREVRLNESRDSEILGTLQHIDFVSLDKRKFLRSSVKSKVKWSLLNSHCILLCRVTSIEVTTYKSSLVQYTYTLTNSNKINHIKTSEILQPKKNQITSKYFQFWDYCTKYFTWQHHITSVVTSNWCSVECLFHLI